MYRLAVCVPQGPGLPHKDCYRSGGRCLINPVTKIAGREAGVGQVGAGTVRAPMGCFTAALEALAAAHP